MRVTLAALLLSLAVGGASSALTPAAAQSARHRAHARHHRTKTRLRLRHRTRRATTNTKLIWSDGFSGPSGSSPDPSVWTFDTGGTWGNGRELQYYTSRPANASLDGRGDLVITARRETYTGPDGVTRGYTSARLETWRKLDFTYGQIAARIRVPSGAGLLPQFWAVGGDAYANNDWPASGEIDVMENDGSDPLTLYGTIHGPRAGFPDGYAVQRTYHAPSSLAAGFHVYSADWTPDEISFQIDGHTYQTVKPADLQQGATWPFTHPFFLVLDLVVGGNWAGPPSGATPWPAKMVVDWVRVSRP